MSISAARGNGRFLAGIRVSLHPAALRIHWFQGVLLASVFVASSCDRESLSEGPRISGQQGGDEEPPPDDGEPKPPAEGIPILVNEVMVQNTKTLADETGQYWPWIELYNNTDEEMDLGGLPVSDDVGDPEKWRVPTTHQAKVPPRGFLVILCSGDAGNDGDLQANFTLPSKGKVSIVVNKGTSDIFEFFSGKVGADLSTGRFPDGGDVLATGEVFTEATPGAANKVAGVAGEAASAPQEGEFLRGDASGDGAISALDMTAVLDVLFRARLSPRCLDRLDANDDGAIDISDALFTGDALLGRASFPPPHPKAGQDPTADSLSCPRE